MQPSATTSFSRTPGFFRDQVLKRLSRLQGGVVRISDQYGQGDYGNGYSADALCAQIQVSNQEFYKISALQGAIGAAIAYQRGWWEGDHLTDLFRILVRNIGTESSLERRLSSLVTFGQFLAHKTRINTRKISRKNISAHYDLGNDFFELFLDETLTYSCALYSPNVANLAEASIAKLARLAEKLDISAEHSVLEIGSGWGSNAIFLAQTYGCHVVTTTISERQFETAKQRVKEAGLQDRVKVLLTDYRDLTGSYDRVVSVEMVEAIGHRQLPTFFSKVDTLLAPTGLAAIQVITMPDQGYEKYLRSVDVIRTLVFPGSTCPSRTALMQAATQASQLRLVHLEEIGPHYAKTLAEWRRNLATNKEAILARGFSLELLRLWEFYLCYCEAGFAERHIGDVQLVFSKRDWRGEVQVQPLTAPEDVLRCTY